MILNIIIMLQNHSSKKKDTRDNSKTEPFTLINKNFPCKVGLSQICKGKEFKFGQKVVIEIN